MNSNEAYKQIVKRVGHDLRSLGFKKGSSNHVRDLEEVNHIVGFQRSSSTRAEYLKLTVNIGVNCKLIDSIRGSQTLRTAIGSHIQRRIGEFQPNFDDKWWVIVDEDGLESAVREIIIMLHSYVLPKLELAKSSQQILDLWESGNEPLLTYMIQVQQEEYHDILFKALQQNR